MSITAKIIADSKNSFGNRITTMELVFPRIILAEAKTHRLISQNDIDITIEENISLNSATELSKNSASSRAIPFKKMVKQVQDNPFIPIAWQKEHTGMQGTEYFTDEKDISWFKMNHLKARDQAVERAIDANERGLTKQLCNRYLEPFIYHKVLVTATEFDNFFKLRSPEYLFNNNIYKSKKEIIKSKHKPFRFKINENEFIEYKDVFNDDRFWLSINKGQSEIHIMALAEAMYNAINESTPKLLKAGEYHIPYSDNIDDEDLSNFLIGNNGNVDKGGFDLNISEAKIRISVARCARLSYQTLGDNPVIDYKKDIQLYNTLTESGHFSPLEHVARCMSEEEYYSFYKGGNLYFYDNFKDDNLIGKTIESALEVGNKNSGWCANFRGFTQYRYLIENKEVSI